MYYIEEITIVSKNGRQSNVDFTNGLNIICGESNTGKSLIVDCINYMYGAQKHRFDDKLNIREIQISLNVDGKSLKLIRELDSTSVYIQSEVENIDNGLYYVSNKGENSLFYVWLKILGIDHPVNIVRTLDGKIQKLTYRTFSHLFLIDEAEIIKTDSILANRNSMGSKVSTAVLSSLIYLATEKTYLPEKSRKNKTIREERKDAVQQFVNRSLSQISQNNPYKQKGIDKTPEELRNSIELILQEIETNKGLLKEKTELRNKILNDLLIVNDKIKQCNVLYERNSNLATQYTSDIKRLAFITEGDIHSDNIPTLDHCPFCNGELPKKQSESCIQAAIVEVRKIQKQIEDLRSVQDSLINEINDLSNSQLALKEKKNKIEKSIQDDLKPKINSLKKQLNAYSVALEQKKTLEVTRNISEILLSELKATVDDETYTLKIEIPEYFANVFKDKIEIHLNNLLQECKYHNYVNCRFDIPSYDIVINNQTKKSQGKGFRAYLNTLLAIAIQDCLIDYNMHIPRTLVIDSPILTLKEKEDHADNELVSNTMKVGLFEYLVKHQDNKQIIIIENEIPNIDYKDTNIIHFTKDENQGRFGLLYDFRD